MTETGLTASNRPPIRERALGVSSGEEAAEINSIGLTPTVDSAASHVMISSNPPLDLKGIKFQARTRIFLPIMPRSRLRMAQQIVEDPSEKEMQ